jgi:hypothetical protein
MNVGYGRSELLLQFRKEAVRRQISGKIGRPFGHRHVHRWKLGPCAAWHADIA